MLKTYMLFHQGWIPQVIPVETILHCTMAKFIKDKDNTENSYILMLPDDSILHNIKHAL